MPNVRALINQRGKLKKKGGISSFDETKIRKRVELIKTCKLKGVFGFLVFRMFLGEMELLISRRNWNMDELEFEGVIICHAFVNNFYE